MKGEGPTVLSACCICQVSVAATSTNPFLNAPNWVPDGQNVNAVSIKAGLCVQLLLYESNEEK